MSQSNTKLVTIGPSGPEFRPSLTDQLLRVLRTQHLSAAGGVLFSLTERNMRELRRTWPILMRIVKVQSAGAPMVHQPDLWRLAMLQTCLACVFDDHETRVERWQDADRAVRGLFLLDVLGAHTDERVQ